MIDRYIFVALVLLLYLSHTMGEFVLLDSVSGVVGRGNFTHWSMGYTGHIVLTLTSIEGDSDLYVTDKSHKPTYEPDSYDLHSATCGLDIVEIPKNFQRPISIGIYGHPSYENSSYLLEVQYDIEKSQERNIYKIHEFDENTIKSKERRVTEEENENKPTGVKKFKIKTKLIASMWSLLEFFDIVFTI